MNLKKKFGLPSKIDTKRLITSLTNSKIATENNALYQTIYRLINGVSDFEQDTQKSVTSIQSAISGGDSGGGTANPGLTNATYITHTGQQAILPSSRELVAGTSITFTDNGITLVISSDALTIDFVVMSNGDVDDPQPMNDGNGNFIYIPYNE